MDEDNKDALLTSSTDSNRTESKSNSSSSVSGQAQGDSWWGGWGQAQGWIDAVKEKSASTLEMVKKDLNEFVDVIQGDTSVAMNETAEKLEKHVEDKDKIDKKEDSGSMGTAEFMKQGVKGLSQVLHSMSELMQVQEPDDSNEEFITLTEGSFSLQGYNRKQEKLHLLQTDPGTYCNEPEGNFNDWLQIFIIDEHKQDMSNLLTQNSAVRAIYSKLVPDVISHTTFWQRYYFRVFQLESEERKREELLARADKNMPGNNGEDDEDGGWGDDDDDDIEIVKNSNPTAQKEIENPQKDKEISQTPTKDVSKNDTASSGETSDKFKLQMTSPLVQSMRGNEEHKSDTACENIPLKVRDKDDNKSLLNSTIDTIEDENKIEKENKQNLEMGSITEKEFEITDGVAPSTSNDKSLLTPEHGNPTTEISETTSVGSWVSIDDDIKVKKIKGEQSIQNEADTNRPVSDGGSSSSSAVLVNKSEADDLDDLDDDDLDIDLDDVNDEEISELVKRIKNKDVGGDDDDDWENWE